MLYNYACSKSRVNQEREFVNTAGQNDQEGIYSLLQPPEDVNDSVTAVYLI